MQLSHKVLRSLFTEVSPGHVLDNVWIWAEVQVGHEARHIHQDGANHHIPHAESSRLNKLLCAITC